MVIWIAPSQVLNFVLLSVVLFAASRAPPTRVGDKELVSLPQGEEETFPCYNMEPLSEALPVGSLVSGQRKWPTFLSTLHTPPPPPKKGRETDPDVYYLV